LQYDHVLVPLLGAAYTLTAAELWRHTAGRHGSNSPSTNNSSNNNKTNALQSTGVPHHHNGSSTPSGSSGARFVVVENGAGGAQLANGAAMFGLNAPLLCKPTTRAGFSLYHTTPLLGNGWGYVGELVRYPLFKPSLSLLNQTTYGWNEEPPLTFLTFFNLSNQDSN
jgi:hypothetical protein